LKKKWTLLAIPLIIVIIVFIGINSPILQSPNPDRNTETDTNQATLLTYASNFNESLKNLVIEGFENNGQNGSVNVRQAEFLESFSLQEQENCILNGSFADIDWDNDRMNNYFEYKIAGQPFEVYNERYAVLVDTDKPQQLYNSMRDMASFLLNEEKFLTQNVVLLESTNATVNNFKQAISNLSEKATENDIVYIGLSSHGSDGALCFNDGHGVNNGPEGMTYVDIDKIIDQIKSRATVVTVFACWCHTALEPLKSGPSPRIVLTMTPEWFFATSAKYENGWSALPSQYDIPIYDTQYDVDHNGYVSIGESWTTLVKAQGRYYSYHPDQRQKNGMTDTSDISQSLYFGDFEVSADGVPTWPVGTGLWISTMSRYDDIKSQDSYTFVMIIKNYDLNSVSLNLTYAVLSPDGFGTADYLNGKTAAEFGEFAPIANVTSPIVLTAPDGPDKFDPLSNSGQYEAVLVTLKTGKDSPWQSGTYFYVAGHGVLVLP
jgi:hypothetical protein